MPGTIKLKTGELSPELLSLLLNQIGLELTLVDDEDRYVYFTDVANPIFERTADIIGTHILDCHSEATHAGIMEMIRQFRDGEKDSEWNWSDSNRRRNRWVRATYRAIRDEAGTYKGCVEIIEDLTEAMETRE